MSTDMSGRGASAASSGEPSGPQRIRRWLEIGGLAAAVILIAFGIAAIGLSIQGRKTVHTELQRQRIVGASDMNPTETAIQAKEAGLPANVGLPTCDVAGKKIADGEAARCFASYMRIHALEGTGNLTYSQIPQYATANGKGTNEATDALENSRGEPVENPDRILWVTETALSTGLNAAYMAEQLALFGIVVGVALLLSGIGFGIIALSGALRSPETALARSIARRYRAAHSAQPPGQAS